MTELTRENIINLLTAETTQQTLFQKADAIRRQYVGDEVHLRALMEFSNICRNNCLYCGIRRGNSNVKRYRLSDEEIIATAQHAAQLGFKTVVMQSGEDMYFTADRMSRIIAEIKKFDVAVTLSLGERSYAEYKAFREAGADRYLIRIETTDKDLYHRLDPQMSWQQRYECLLALKELGYEVGSGIMVGLPNQSIESIADDLLFLHKLDIDMAGIGPFIAHAETPLAKCANGSFSLALRTMAVMRIMLPDINIPATTAMAGLEKNGHIKALQSGANVIMPNVTTVKYRRLYELYPGKPALEETAEERKAEIEQAIKSIGRSVGKGYGEHKRVL